MPKIAIAVDGPGSSGKGTVAQGVARALGYQYVDTGAMYRAVAWFAREAGISWTDGPRVAELARSLKFQFSWDGDNLRVKVNDTDLTVAIRCDEIGRGASDVSVHPEVRSALLSLQQDLGHHGGLVMDGRDIGTVVLPDAQVKIFLDADLEERARRRFDELKSRGEEASYPEVLTALLRRDRQDRERPVAPLRQAKDAVYMDTSQLTIQEATAMVLALAKARGAGSGH